MFEEFSKVRIKSSGITGVIVDISRGSKGIYYTVESNEKGVPGGYGSDDSWKLFDCTEDELEKL